jgi:uncharacterized protein involved in exopolysaccharide biosynthesis
MSDSQTGREETLRAPNGYASQSSADVSLLDLVTLTLRHRWRVILWGITFGVIVALPAMLRSRSYTSTASFVLQGTDQGRAGLTGLAGQLGVQLSAGGSLSQSPQFYADLLRTRELLGGIADDSFRIEPHAARAVPFVELFEIPGASAQARRDAAIRRLSQSLVNVRVSKGTGVVGVDVTTPWPHVSRAIASDLLTGVNRFSLMMRQTQAAAERRFGEERLEASRASLRVAEDRLAAFLQSNRQYQNSPELLFAHDRLQREVALQQQVFMSVVQGYEDARNREARNTPVITVVDSASVPTSPNARGILPRLVVGILLGALLSITVLYVRYGLLRDRADNPEVARLRTALTDAKRDFTRWLPRSRARVRRSKFEGVGSTDT